MSKHIQTKLDNEREIEKVEKLDLKTAENIASITLTMVDAWCKKIEIVGSIRRKRHYIHDIDFVVLTYEDEAGEHWWGLKDTVMDYMDGKLVLNGSEILRFFVPLAGGRHVQLDFYRAKTEKTYGILKLIRTGSALHNVWLAKYAISKGLRLKYSVGLVKDGEVVASETEESIFEALRLPYIKPELREIVGGIPLWKRKSV